MGCHPKISRALEFARLRGMMESWIRRRQSELGAAFQQCDVGEQLPIGRRLAVDHRYDRIPKATPLGGEPEALRQIGNDGSVRCNRSHHGGTEAHQASKRGTPTALRVRSLRPIEVRTITHITQSSPDAATRSLRVDRRRCDLGRRGRRGAASSMTRCRRTRRPERLARFAGRSVVPQRPDTPPKRFSCTFSPNAGR